MSTNSECIVRATGVASQRAWPLHDVVQTRQIEAQAADGVSTFTLMQRAGLAVARLTLALAPHAKCIWIACGPGNNGGDGIEAALHLLAWGKRVVVTRDHDPASGPADACLAWQRAQAAGVTVQTEVPADFDACVDALFGIGMQRPLTGIYAEWVQRMNAATVPVIAVDTPTGLDAESGATQSIFVLADYTLSLLTLKPGLFTASGRDACGDIWFNRLGVNTPLPPQATLAGAPPSVPRPHASHKGSYGDVIVVGGAAGMVGAAVLAATSALHAGAGRVFVCLLDDSSPFDPVHPELMYRAMDSADVVNQVVVAGCGGGTSIAHHLPRVLKEAGALVLDADALNQVAQNPDLQAQVRARGAQRTVITPHPLEAARLLDISVGQVQANRLTAARALAERYQCTVVLKGSGTVIAAPAATPFINPTGNAKLATAGSGDVLAGLLGALMAQGLSAADAACAATYQHGMAADLWQSRTLSASELCHW